MTIPGRGDIDMGGVHDRSRPDCGVTDLWIPQLRKIESQINRILKRGKVHSVDHILSRGVSVVLLYRNESPLRNGLRGSISDKFPLNFLKEYECSISQKHRIADAPE